MERPAHVAASLREAMSAILPCWRSGKTATAGIEPAVWPASDTGEIQVFSGMMAQRAWPLGSDPAGVGTAMITSAAVPALLPARIGVSQAR